jgi:hypothetical protein
MKIEVVPFNPGMLDDFISRMGADRLADIRRGWGEPRDVIGASVALSGKECYMILANGRAVVLFGAAKNSIGANVWTIQADGFESVKFGFMRTGQRFIAEWGKRFGTLYGHVNAAFPRMIRWLERCGFEAHPLGAQYGNYVEVIRWDSR